jgi:hypothetical protein
MTEKADRRYCMLEALNIQKTAGQPAKTTRKTYLGGGGQQFAYFQPIRWVGPASAISPREASCPKAKTYLGGGEVRFRRVFSPKTQFNPVFQYATGPETLEELTEERSNIGVFNSQKMQVNPIEFSSLKFIF